MLVRLGVFIDIDNYMLNVLFAHGIWYSVYKMYIASFTILSSSS